jgi:hypothetical protein
MQIATPLSGIDRLAGAKRTVSSANGSSIEIIVGSESEKTRTVSKLEHEYHYFV